MDQRKPSKITVDSRARWDLLRLPILGPVLSRTGSRVLLQLPLFLVAMIMIGHAFFGPDLAPKNLSTLLTWVHFRGFVVLAILISGNLFCMACPFMLPRDFLRKFISPKLEWPKRLSNKWLSATLFVSVLFTYELFDLWGDPWWTGMLIVIYFLIAMGVDSIFKRASFCKYVCPIGQFNFLASELSPLEVSVRDLQVCDGCATKDCIKGRAISTANGDRSLGRSLPIVQRGCELALFQPRKIGNLDCTFCMDCIYACPHDNVGILSRIPVESLSHTGTRSGIGIVEKRLDFTFLIAVFTFGAVLNAFAMISPVYALEQFISHMTGLRVEWPVLGAIFVATLVIEPALLLGLAAAVTRSLTRASSSVLSIVNLYARSLIPIGFGIWLAHYAFHFLTGFLTVIPVTQNAVREMFGVAVLGEPMWQLGGLPEATVFPIEVGFISLGLLGSCLTAWLITSSHFPERQTRAVSPWIALNVILFVAAVWIMTQPMDMRGTFLAG